MRRWAKSCWRPSDSDDVGRLAASALHCDLERARPLSLLVYEKTGGNPFFAIQFLRELADEGLLAFDPVAQAWRWEIDRIHAKGYTDNVVDLMVEKLKRLFRAEPGGDETTRLPWPCRRDRHPDPGPRGNSGGDARDARGGRLRRPHRPAGRAHTDFCMIEFNRRHIR